MAIIKTHNAQGGSDARYDTSRMTDAERARFDGDGRPLGADNPGQWDWTQGLPGAREMNAEGGGGGGGGGGFGLGSAVLQQQVAAGLAEYKKALARLNQGRQLTMTQYGYAGDIDPEQGTLKNMRVDSANPYGLYQGFRRNNAKQYDQLRGESAERRIGSRGLGAQGISDARWAWGKADADMASALTQTLAGFDTEQQGAYQRYENLKWQLELELAREAAMAAQFSGGGWDPGGSEEDVALGRPANDGAGPDQSDVISRLMARGGSAAYGSALTAAAAKKKTPTYTPAAVKAMGARYNAMAAAYRR